MRKLAVFGSMAGRLDLRTSRHLVSALALALPVSLLGASPSSADHDVPLSGCLTPDNGDPVLKDLSISPDDINVRGSAASVTIRVVFSDTGGPGSPSGVVRAGGLLTRRPNGNRKHVRLRDAGGGAWVATIPFFRGSRPGSWRLGLYAYDRVGNKQRYTSTALRELGLPHELVVESVYDTEPPEIVNLSLSPDSVDTRERPRTVRIAVKIRDNLEVRAAFVELDGKAYSGPGYLDLSRTKGTSRSGTWTGSLRLGRWAGAAAVELSLHVRPKAGGYRLWDSSRLRRLGWPSTIDVVGHTDKTAPVMNQLAVSPAVVDVRAADATVEISVRVQDAGSGVRAVRALRVRHVDNNYVPYVVELRRISGTAGDGVWAGTFTVHHCDGASALAEAYVGAVDGVDRGASVSLSEAVGELRAEDRRPPNVTPDEGLASPGVVAMTFDEDVTSVTPESMVVFTYDPDTGDFDYAPVPGAWVCRDAAGSTVTCVSGHVRGATFQPNRTLDPQPEFWVRVNPEHSFGVRDLYGNAPRRDDAPASWD